ncbi:MAG: DUF4397 domain-containing protein [Chloroflexaceae bacterium]|nr:DUF4397 domain-containing protein [Chloroflexaceae bacterium]
MTRFQSFVPSSLRAALLALFALLLVATLLPAATPARAADEGEAEVATASNGKGRVRAVHAVPDFGAVDVYVNHNRVLRNVRFFTVSDYLSLDPGSYRVQVIPANENINHPSLFVVNEQVEVVANFDYSLVASGSVAGNSVDSTILIDNNLAPPVGKARVRAAHFSPNAPGVDIYVNGQKQITNLTFSNTTGYLPLDPGTYSIGIAPTGGSVIFTGEATLAAGQVATIWANGLLGGNGGQAFKLTPTVDARYSETTRIRAVHAIPDIAGSPVDVYVNGAKAVTFDFFNVTDYLTIYAGRTDIRVTLKDKDPETEAVIKAVPTFAANRDFSVVARGTGGNFGATVISDNNSKPERGKARVRAAHVSPNAPAVDVYVNGQKVITNLNFMRASDYLSVAPGTYTIGIAPTGGNIIFTSEATVAAGQVITIWANGLLNSSGAQAFKLTPSVDAEFKTFRLRAVHAIPQLAGSPVDVYVNGEKALTFDFFTVSDYVTLDEGSYDIRVVPKGGNPETQAVIRASVPFAGGKDYSVVARIVDGQPGATVLEDNNSKPEQGKARIRAAHFSPNAPGVDIFVNGQKQITNLTFTNASDYLSVAPGIYTIGIAPTGGSVIFTQQLRVREGQVATAWANGLLNTEGAQRFKVTRSIDADFGPARARFIHALPTLQRVDIFVNGQRVADGVRFATITGYSAIQPGQVTIEVRIAGGSEVLLRRTVQLEASRDYTLALVRPGPAQASAAETASASVGMAVLEDDNTPAANGKARLRVVNLSPDAPTMDVRAGNRTLLGGLSYTEAAYTDVAAGQMQADMTAEGTSRSLAQATLSLAPGSVTTVFMLGLTQGASEDQRLRGVSSVDVAAVNVIHLPFVTR